MIELYGADVDFLAQPEIFRSRYVRVPEARKAKIDAFRGEGDRRLSLGVWLLLEHGLRARGFAQVPSVAVNDWGRPYFPEYPELCFSLSHSGSRVVCALSDSMVGCDVERMKKPNDKLARRFFGETEQTYFRAAASEEERLQRFYRIWTLKESYIKAMGKGLAIPLPSFSLDWSGTEPKLPQHPELFFRSIADAEGYCWGCCAEGFPVPEIRMVDLKNEKS